MNRTHLIAAAFGVVVLILVLLWMTGVFSSSSSSSSGSSSSNGSDAGNNSTPGGATQCTSTTGCTSPQICQGGACANPPPVCGSGPACPTGQTCVSGSCVDSTTICTPACTTGQNCVNNACTTPPACTDSSGCDHGQTCSSGVCVCASDANCPTGQWCNSGACVTDPCPSMTASPDGLGCYHGTYQNCTSSLQCPTGTTCDIANGGYCIPATCKADTDCVNTKLYTCGNGICEVTTCSINEHCGAGYYCSGGHCNKITSCNTDYPCTSSTETCYNGMCLPACNYTDPSPCASGYACIPDAKGTAFNTTNMDGVCLQRDTTNPHSVFNMPSGIQCGTSNDCPDQWSCNSGVCSQYPSTTTCSATDMTTVPPGYYCAGGSLVPTKYNGCAVWQEIDVNTTTCSTTNWSPSDAVPIGCIGQTGLTPTDMGVKISKTTDGTQYNMTPVVFRLAGTNAPNYPLYGFYNSNGSTGPSFTTFDLGGWLEFTNKGAFNNNAKSSNYSSCYVVEAAYLTMSGDSACTDPHIPAWNSGMWSELPLTYDGLPFCYNTPGALSRAPVSGTENAPSTFMGVRSNLSSQGYCIAPANSWGGSSGPESGSLDGMIVYASDGAN